MQDGQIVLFPSLYTDMTGIAEVNDYINKTKIGCHEDSSRQESKINFIDTTCAAVTTKNESSKPKKSRAAAASFLSKTTLSQVSSSNATTLLLEQKRDLRMQVMDKFMAGVEKKKLKVETADAAASVGGGTAEG